MVSGYYKYQKSAINSFSPSDVGLACSHGGYSLIVLPWRYHCAVANRNNTPGVPVRT